MPGLLRLRFRLISDILPRRLLLRVLSAFFQRNASHGRRESPAHGGVRVADHHPASLSVRAVLCGSSSALSCGIAGPAGGITAPAGGCPALRISSAARSGRRP